MEIEAIILGEISQVSYVLMYILDLNIYLMYIKDIMVVSEARKWNGKIGMWESWLMSTKVRSSSTCCTVWGI